MSRKRMTGLVAALTLVAVSIPAVAVATTDGSPKPGRWHLDDAARADGFTVAGDGHSLADLRVTGTACKLKSITMVGSVQVHADQGSWIVGSADPSRKSKYDRSGVVGKPVTLHSGGKTLHGRLDIVFSIGGFARDNDGILTIKDCDIDFSPNVP